jgi:CheY-like chemotaxis protein
VTRIQDFTRIRKDKPREKVDLNRVVRNAVEMTKPHWKQAAERTGNRVEVVVEAGEVDAILGNPSELVQVVSNLLFNATDALPQGGSILLRTDMHDGEVRLTVTDTGIGMSDEVKARVFEPFFTTKEHGQGLGTSIVYGIVGRHEGRIEVESAPGKGTTFTLHFRSHGPSLSAPASLVLRAPDLARAAAPARILIIEDEEQNRDVYRSILESKGFEVECAPEGKTGLELLAARPFDVVITDLSMPGMSGWDVARGVKSHDPRLPVILLSGWAVQEDEAQAEEAGVDHVLCKPCRLDELLGTIRLALETREAA